MAGTFKDKTTEAVASGKCPKGFPADLLRVAQRKLAILRSAAELKDLASPPGNRLEKLKGNRNGQYSIRINDQFRICFRWENDRAEDIEITDYH